MSCFSRFLCSYPDAVLVFGRGADDGGVLFVSVYFWNCSGLMSRVWRFLLIFSEGGGRG